MRPIRFFFFSLPYRISTHAYLAAESSLNLLAFAIHIPAHRQILMRTVHAAEAPAEEAAGEAPAEGGEGDAPPAEDGGAAAEEGREQTAAAAEGDDAGGEAGGGDEPAADGDARKPRPACSAPHRPVCC